MLLIFNIEDLSIGDSIKVENIENIKPDNLDKLLADLKDRTGLDIQRFEIRRTNFLRDTARIRIYYKD